MSNEPTAVAAKDVVFDIKALLLGAAPVKATSARAQGIAAAPGNTKKTTDDPEKLKRAIQESVDYLEKFAKDNQFNLKFSVDDKSDSIVVQVLEVGTGKVIRKFPRKKC
jgi:uncharacterized FlaG/YvyC family protein